MALSINEYHRVNEILRDRQHRSLLLFKIVIICVHVCLCVNMHLYMYMDVPCMFGLVCHKVYIIYESIHNLSDSHNYDDIVRINEGTMLLQIYIYMTQNSPCIWCGTIIFMLLPRLSMHQSLL